MTQSQRDTIKWAVTVGLAIATVVFSLGMARHELDGKEDAAAHARDLEQLRGEIKLQFVRDSAERADTRRVLVDIACQLNPKRGYCAARIAP